MKIRCKLVDTKHINSEWNRSLDGLTGTIIHAETTGWGGYQVDVKLDNPPGWFHGHDICHCVYVAETKGRDIIAEVSAEDMETIRLFVRGVIKCDSCGAHLPEHYEGCITLNR